VLNNRDPSNSAQVKELLLKVGNMGMQTKEGFYTNNMFLEAEAAIREEQTRMLREKAEGEEQDIFAKRRKCDLETYRVESSDIGSRRRELEIGRDEDFRMERWTEESRGNPFSFLRNRVERCRDKFRGSRSVSRRQSLHSSLTRTEAALSAKVLERIKIMVAAGATGLAVGAVFGAAAPLAAAAGASLMGNSIGFAASQFAGMSVAGGSGVGNAVGALVAAASGKTAVALGAATGGALGGSFGVITAAEAASRGEGAVDTLEQVCLIGASAVGVAAGVGGILAAGAALGAALSGAAAVGGGAAAVAIANVASVAGSVAPPLAAAVANAPVAAGTPGVLCGFTGPGAGAAVAVPNAAVASVAGTVAPSSVVSDPLGTVSTPLLSAVAEIRKVATVALAGGLVVKVVKKRVSCGTATTEASVSEEVSCEISWNKQ